MDDTQSLRQIAQSPTPFSTWVAVVLLFLLFGAIVLAVIGPSPRRDNYEAKRAADRVKKLEELRKQDAIALTSYAWLDKQKGTARIPIDRAMELTVAELAQKKPTAAGPIATPQPQPQAPAAAAGAAAPPASAPPPSSPVPSVTPTRATVEGHGARAQPAAGTNPPGAGPGTQPGASASPAASAPPVGVPPAQSSPTQNQSPPGSPLPVRGATPQTM
jgi:hypothetical protein